MDHSKKSAAELQAIFNKQLDDLWFSYLKHCVDERVSPVSRERFAEAVHERIMGMIAAQRAERFEDWSDVYIVAAAVKNTPPPISESVIKQCSQCGQDVWLSPQFKDKHDQAKGIICTDCAPELTGKDMGTIVKEDLEDL